MSFLSRVNVIRRKATNALTKNVDNDSLEKQIAKNPHIEIKRVLISRPNHRLGNMLLITPLLQEVAAAFPECKIDLFVKGGAAPVLLENYKYIDKIIKLPKKHFDHLFDYFNGWISLKKQPYDLVINGDKNSSSGRLSTKFAKGSIKIYGDINASETSKYSDFMHIAKYPVYNFRQFLSMMKIDRNSEPMPVLDIKLNPSEIAQGKKILQSIADTTNKTICIYTNATGNKCYSEEWWETFYARLKTEYPHCNIIEMLPIENISKINFKAPNFYSKDVREMASIIRNTNIFISADNGVMHLASASLTPTIGFFSGVTNSDIYEPYGNGSLALNTHKTSIEDWIKEINQILK